jgi:hypothetical protein
VVANSNNQVTIAIAGLVDGVVGSSGAGITIKQAGAGWSKPFSASTKAVFRPPAGNRRYLRVVNAAGVNAQARGYEDMTDVDTGTGPFPTTGQDATCNVMYNVGYSSVSGAPWFLIATDKWVIFSLADAISPNYSVGQVFFGDFLHSVVPGDLYATFLATIGNKYFCRGYSGAPGSVVVGVRDSDGASAAWPSVIFEGTRFIPYIPVVENAVLRGFLPNAYKLMPHVPNNRFLDIYGDIAGTSSRMKPLSIGPGNVPFSFSIAIDEDVWL